MATEDHIPSDMVEVGYDEFHSFIGNRDIVLDTQPYYTVWETRYRQEVARTFPGYKYMGAKRYFVRRGSASA